MTEAFINQLSNSTSSVRRDALTRCLRLPKEERTEALCAAVAELLRDKDFTIRELAARVIAKLGCIYPSILPALVGSLVDEVAGVREKILDSIQYYPPDERLQPTLQGLLSDHDSSVRIKAARAHWRHVRDPLAIKQLILDSLGSERSSCVIHAAQLAAEMVEDREEFIDPLIRLLSSTEGGVRGNALFALSKIAVDMPETKDWAYRLKDDQHPLVKYIASRIIPGLP
jgi:HEAT repeat protein